MTLSGAQLLLALAAVASAAGIVVWILLSRTAAEKRAREKAVTVARSRAQVRARVSDEANRRRRASEEREIALARLAARLAEHAKRREELLRLRVDEKRVEAAAIPPTPVPKLPSQPQHHAQPSEAREPMASKEGSPTDVVPDPAGAALNAVTTDAVDEADDGARQSKDAVAITGPEVRPLSLPAEPAVPPQPLNVTDAAAVADAASYHAAPQDAPVTPEPHLPFEAEIPLVPEARNPITPEAPGLEAAEAEVVPSGAFGEEPCSPEPPPTGAEYLLGPAAVLTATGLGEEVISDETPKDREGHAPTQNRESLGTGQALHDDSSIILEAGIGGLEDIATTAETIPAALEAETRTGSELTQEPRATDEGLIQQALPGSAWPLDVPDAAPMNVEVKDSFQAEAPTEKAEGEGSEESVAAPEAGSDWEPSFATAKQQRQYRPVKREPARVRPYQRHETAGSRDRDRGCPVDVRVLFAKGGSCRVSLLPRRAKGMPPNLRVSGPGGSFEISEMQDDWYEDVVTPRLGDLLAHGVAWESVTSGGERYSWALGGRAVYVLCAQPQLSGYVNTQRLILNEKHVVLSLVARKDDVLAAIAQAGSPVPAVLGSESGVPENWVALRDVVPRRSVPGSQEGDILDCLRPLPEAELSLEGGIRLEGNSWLAGFPPQIRVRGDQASVTSLFIDGHGAIADATGAFVANGWDAIGQHTVATSIGTRAYTIEEEREEWQPWTAHTWSLGEESGVDDFQRPAICGALVQAPRAAPAAGRAVVVPASNAILIGEAPGEIEICRPHSDPLNKLCIGFPNFEPVWAIPSAALRCDKRTARVIHLRSGPGTVDQGSPVRAPHGSGRGRRHDLAQRAWSSAILAAARKGLAVNPHEQLIVDLWKLYRERARALARSKA